VSAANPRVSTDVAAAACSRTLSECLPRRISTKAGQPQICLGGRVACETVASATEDNCGCGSSYALNSLEERGSNVALRSQLSTILLLIRAIPYAARTRSPKKLRLPSRPGSRHLYWKL
jgi:hypothetical protein